MPVTSIVDSADPRLDDYRGLTDVALRRVLESTHGLYMAEGAKVIARAVTAGHTPRSVLLTEKWLDGVLALLGPLADDVPIYVAPDTLVEEVAGFQVHRGALAAMNRPVLPTVQSVVLDARMVVILDGIVDHTNVGAIFRSVAALGADAVVVSPTCADPLYRRSIKVSMGTVFQVPWTRAEHWPRVLDDLRADGFVVAALALDDQALSLREFAAAGHDRVAIILGAEGDGLSRSTVEQADVTVTIPMAGDVDSLNVAAASAVALWELGAHTHERRHP